VCLKDGDVENSLRAISGQLLALIDLNLNVE